jgi:hypothetical protein
MVYPRRPSVPRVAIIILNLNGWKDTIECLKSLCAIDYPAYDIVVVDNGSKDDSVEKIKEYAYETVTLGSKIFELHSDSHSKGIGEENEKCKEQAGLIFRQNLVLMKNERNYGFAEGNNIGIRYVKTGLKPDYFLLLNNDVVVDTKFLGELVEIGERDPKIGVIGPKIYYYDFKGRRDVINFAGEDLVVWKVQGIRYGGGEIDEGQHDSLREVDKIDGSCMLIKREVIEEVGLLDSDFFSYWEETDFCSRAKRKGYKMMYVPTAKIWHKIAMSTGGLFSPIRIYYLARNRLLFAGKNLNSSNQLKFLIYFICYSFWLNVGTLLKNRKGIGMLPHFLKGTFDGLTSLQKYQR